MGFGTSHIGPSETVGNGCREFLQRPLGDVLGGCRVFPPV